jgi:hypothetical protein
MSEPTRNLWPVTEINVLSPIAILRQQATYLREATQGILEAEVAVLKGDPWTITSFWIVAPALDRYRFELFKIAHNATDPYPVQIFYDGLFATDRINLREFLVTYAEFDTPFTVSNPEDEPDDPITDTILVVASSQDDFMRILETILASTRTQRTLHSLIARTNDMGLEPVGR